MTEPTTPTRLIISRTTSISEYEPSTLYWVLTLDPPTVDMIRKLQRSWQVAHDVAEISFVTHTGWLGTAFEATPELDALIGAALHAVDNLYPTVIVDLTPELDAALDAAEYTQLSPSYVECDGATITLWAFVGDGDTRVSANEILRIEQLELLIGTTPLPRTDRTRDRAPRWAYLPLDTPSESPEMEPEPSVQPATHGYRAARGVLANMPTLDALTVEALRAGVVATRLALQAELAAHDEHHDTPICQGEHTCLICATRLPHYVQALRLALPLLAEHSTDVLAAAQIPLALRLDSPLISELHLLATMLPPTDACQWEQREIVVLVAVVEAARRGLLLEAFDRDLLQADLPTRDRLRLFSTAITTACRVLDRHGVAARSMDELEALHASFDEPTMLATIARL